MKRMIISALLIFATHSLAAAQKAAATVTLEGQIVCCVDCWVKADRKTIPYGTAADLAQAVQCIGNGDPTACGSEYKRRNDLLPVDQGRFRRPGKNWLDYIGKRAAVIGSTRSKKRAVRRMMRDGARITRSGGRALHKARRDRNLKLMLKDLLASSNA